MKKLIALILILVITSFIVVSKDGIPLNQRLDPSVSTGKSKNPNTKNKNWEYVKDRLFDGETENVYRIEGPILLFLNNASKKDSLAVQEIMRDLRAIMPNKTIDYFDNFTGVSFEEKPIDYNKKIKGITFYELRRNTIKLNFIVGEIPTSSLSRIGDNNEIGRSLFNKRGESLYYQSMIVFSFNKLITYERRKRNIQYEILRTLCYINPANHFPYGNNNGVFETADFVPDQAKFNNLDKFLLQKLYSDDFIDQFKTYMYANYPWPYASSFINKTEARFKVFGIIISVGILAFVLMLSYFQGRKYKYSYLNYLLPIFFIFLHFFNLYNIRQYLVDFNSIISWDSHIFAQVPRAIVVSIIVSFVLWGLEKISFKRNANFSYQLILKVIFTFVSFLFPTVLVTAQLYLLNQSTRELFEYLFPYFLFVIGLAIGRGVLLYLNHWSKKKTLS